MGKLMRLEPTQLPEALMQEAIAILRLGKRRTLFEFEEELMLGGKLANSKSEFDGKVIPNSQPTLFLFKGSHLGAGLLIPNTKYVQVLGPLEKPSVDMLKTTFLRNVKGTLKHGISAVWRVSAPMPELEKLLSAVACPYNPLVTDELKLRLARKGLKLFDPFEL
jgi:hypothetical protein